MYRLRWINISKDVIYFALRQKAKKKKKKSKKKQSWYWRPNTKQRRVEKRTKKVHLVIQFLSFVVYGMENSLCTEISVIYCVQRIFIPEIWAVRVKANQTEKNNNLKSKLVDIFNSILFLLLFYYSAMSGCFITDFYLFLFMWTDQLLLRFREEDGVSSVLDGMSINDCGQFITVVKSAWVHTRAFTWKIIHNFSFFI